MKFTENWKRFWSLNRHHAAGFTLVELIVVIAILAILAGVAVPAYSGYIAQANKAADEQLLDALNTAFASACAINGEDHYNRDAQKTKVSLTAVEGGMQVAGLDTENEKIDASFTTYFEGGVFKVFTKLKYDPAVGMFVPADQAGNVTMEYGGATLSIPQEYIAMIEDSTFLQAATLGGTDGLLNKIADVSDVAYVIMGQGGNASNLLNGVIGSAEFNAFAAKALGLDPSDTAAFAAKDAELIAAMRDKDPSLAELTDTELRNKYMINAAVLFAADNATNMNKEDIMASLTNQDVKQNIIDTMASDTTTAFSQATLAYGMYTAWAHASGNTEAQQKDELDVMNDLNNTQFQAWLSSPQGQSDLDAYLAALSVVNASSKDAGAVSDVVVNGFDNSALQEAVGSLFGNG